MNYKNLITEVEDDIAKITINRPGQLNSLNSATLSEMKNFFLNAKEDESVNVVIITGSGDKAFVSGADVKELHLLNSENGKQFSEQGQEVFNIIENLGKPVIAAINGYALGGGCELALACHLRIASDKAKFGLPEVSLGIIPGYGGTQRLPKLINPGRAAELILTGKIIDAHEAYRIGLINAVCKHEELSVEAFELAETIASKGQTAVRLALKAIGNSNVLPLSEGENLESTYFGLCCGTAEFKEGTSAFLEKRKRNF